MREKDLQAIIVEGVIDEPPIRVTYPQAEGLTNKNVQEKINRTILQLVNRMIVQQWGGDPNLGEMLGSYQVTVNKCGVLSIRVENYSIVRMAAHGRNLVRSFTTRLAEGDDYQLVDLFRLNTNYRLVINEQIRNQIANREIQLLNDFHGITDFQEYYLTDKALVVYFQEGELAPRMYGVVEFSIDYSILRNLADPDSPLGLLLNCT